MHLKGCIADMVKVRTIAEKHNLVIVEDACQNLSFGMLVDRTGLQKGAGVSTFQDS